MRWVSNIESSEFCLLLLGLVFRDIPSMHAVDYEKSQMCDGTTSGSVLIHLGYTRSYWHSMRFRPPSYGMRPQGSAKSSNIPITPLQGCLAHDAGRACERYALFAI